MDQFQQRLVAGERSSVLGNLAQTHVCRLDGVGGVDYFADLRSDVEERRDLRLIASPELANWQLVVIPFGFELAKAQLSLFRRAGLVNPLPVSATSVRRF